MVRGHWSPSHHKHHHHGDWEWNRAWEKLGSLGLGSLLARLTSQQVTLLTVMLGYRWASDARMIKPEKLRISVPLNVVSFPLLCVASCKSSETEIHCNIIVQSSSFADGSLFRYPSIAVKTPMTAAIKRLFLEIPLRMQNQLKAHIRCHLTSRWFSSKLLLISLTLRSFPWFYNDHRSQCLSRFSHAVSA